MGSRTQVTRVLVYVASEYRYLKKEHYWALNDIFLRKQFYSVAAISNTRCVLTMESRFLGVWNGWDVCKLKKKTWPRHSLLYK